jgi:hypothetical protein
MDKPEIIKIIRTLSANYRNWPEEDKTEDIVLLWTSMLEDIPGDVGQAAAKIHMSRSPYPPTIADIREAAARIMNPVQMDAMEAWGKVVIAIRKYGMYRQEDAMQSLPEDIRDMVRRFTWRELCLSEQPDIIRAQWRMAWDSQTKYRREWGVLPEAVRHLIESPGLVKRLGDGTNG